MTKLRLLGSLAVTVKKHSSRSSGRSEPSIKNEVKDAVGERIGDNPLDLSGEESRDEHKKHDN